MHPRRRRFLLVVVDGLEQNVVPLEVVVLVERVDLESWK